MIESYESNPHKMTTAQEKAQCVSWFIETKSDVQTQRNYRSMEETHHHVLSRPTITSFNSSIEYRLDVLRATNGAYTEVY